MGHSAVVREEDVLTARQALEKELRGKLDAVLFSRLPDGFVVPDGAVQYSIAVEAVEPAVGSRGDSFDVRMAGTVRALAVKQTDIERVLAAKYGKSAEGTAPAIRNFTELTLRAKNPDFEKHTMTIAAAGEANFVWSVPTDDLRRGLAAASGAAERSAIFRSYPQIRQAAVSYRPSWWKIFPRSEGKIIIQESDGSAR
mgnify:CR=1 FL=1